MAWLQQYPTGTYHISFRFGGRKFKRSLRTNKEHEATARLTRLEENIRLAESGRLDVPDDGDIANFLLSDGKVATKRIVVSKRITLQGLFDGFFASIPDDSLEESTLEGMRIHKRHLVRLLGSDFGVRKRLWKIGRRDSKGDRTNEVNERRSS